MNLGEFKVGDKVQYVIGYGPTEAHSEILYVGEHLVFLRNWKGMEFVRQRESDGFEFYRTPEERLQDQVCRLSVLGRDLVAAIELSIPHHTPRLTAHMRDAIWRFREELRNGL